MADPARPTGPGPEARLTCLRGVGPKRAAALAAAGYHDLGSLLWHLPVRYEDRRTVIRPSAVAAEGQFAVVARVTGLRTIRLRRRRLTMVQGRLEDEEGSLPVVWFNRPWAQRQLAGEREYLLYGRVRTGRGGLEMVNPTCEPADTALEGGSLTPVYSPVAGFGPASVRRLLLQAMETIDLPHGLPDALPVGLLERHQLPALGEALRRLHQPGENADLEALNEGRSAAHRRLIYGELLDQQLEVKVARAARERIEKPQLYRIDDTLRADLLELPPFRLTAAQVRALEEILADLSASRPMLRLLQGDVGSGKTVVAALALLAAVEGGLQGAMMAPTELLAEQHFRGLDRLLGKRCRLSLLTSSAAGAVKERRRIARGEVDLVVGTHALIQESVHFRRLGLAVVDEQHRFGVAQRRRLQRKGTAPDLLIMTATPIPRSLALTAYGELSLSVIDELPPGRMPIVTRVVEQSRRDRVYAWLRRRLAAGEQAYIVLPLIEESPHLAAGSIAGLGDDIRARLDGFATAILHGRTPLEEREEVMRAFAAGEIGVLIATTVVEVGLDVPAATVMVIESAERFGLAQLHQLRGRVGRGRESSYCIAIHGKASDLAALRLERFAATVDGFELADADLELRGPGELLGTRQTGQRAFRVVDLVRDRRWIETARRDAEALLRRPAASVQPLLDGLATQQPPGRLPFAGG
jgi:ATP-dependent DNA helicase RecG